MRRGAGRLILAGIVVLVSPGALAVSLSTALKNYYAGYEIVLECEEQAQLSTEDADAAEAAIEKIETYYLAKDSSIDTDQLLDQAVADKNEGFRITARSGPSDLRPYCRMSLRELLVKAKEIGPAASDQ